jgi:hypothetical protein
VTGCVFVIRNLGPLDKAVEEFYMGCGLLLSFGIVFLIAKRDLRRDG